MISHILSVLGSPEVDLESPDGLVDLVTPVDNSSNRLTEVLWPDCQVEPALHCRTIWMIILTGAKSMIEQLRQLYDDNPSLCALFVGISIGFIVGRAWENRHNLRSRAEEAIFNSQLASLVVAMLCRVPNIISERSNLDNVEIAEYDNSSDDCIQENRVTITATPKHVAVIMDGNRRYGRARYGNVAKGHLDGAKTLVDFAEWCTEEGIEVLTVYAFSTENWNRDPSEIASLMSLFRVYCEELLVKAKQRNIRLCVLSTETERIPLDVMEGLKRMTKETEHCDGGLTMNICLSYGGRGEIVNVCKQLASEVLDGTLQVDCISEKDVRDRLLTSHFSDPDVVIRTSGEFRLSNFLLWQSAYSELFFIPKQWPQLKKEDLMSVIHTYSKGRRRRFGK